MGTILLFENVQYLWLMDEFLISYFQIIALIKLIQHPWAAIGRIKSLQTF